MVKLSRNNLKQQQRRRSQNRRGGLFNSPTCAEDQFLFDGKECVTTCPEGYHGDRDCHPYECVSGAKSGWLNKTRAASCRGLRSASEFTKSKATLAKENWQKFRYEQCKQYIALYEAAQNSDPQAVAALDAVHENAENNKVAQEQAVDVAVAEAVVVAKEEAVAEVQAQTQDMINAAAAAVKEEVKVSIEEFFSTDILSSIYFINSIRNNSLSNLEIFFFVNPFLSETAILPAITTNDAFLSIILRE